MNESKTIFKQAATNAVIYDGFAQGIDALNRTLVSPQMRTLGDGRGYAKPHHRQAEGAKASIHTGLIHAFSFGEDPPEALLESLGKREDLQGSLYMGAAGFLNLALIAEAKPGAAILFDVNPVQRNPFWQTVLSILAREPTGERFMSRLIHQTPSIQRQAAALHAEAGHHMLGAPLPDDASVMQFMMYTYMGSPLDQWECYRAQGFLRWVDDAAGYNHLRAMAQRNAIGVLTIDALDEAAWKQLADHLDTNPAGAPSRAKLVYMSNMLSFMGAYYDPVFRNNPNVPPFRARQIISGLMENPEYGVITDTADPALRWPADSRPPSAKVLPHLRLAR